jgi:eukaryotic-like serine/threonine-protein kinase
MPADPRRAKAIFGAALAVTDPAARLALLDRECGGDAELRQRLDDLLRAHDHPESALERPLAVANGDFRTIDHTPATGPGTVLVGRYKLLELVGEGGMGEVWVADQLEPIRRRVAVKTIKRGMDSKSVLARFEAERQALALMDHPNIAKVLDADTTADGRPFFVMDLVKGTPITEFCDARKLSARERLGLFVQVCHAIQHAHQKGIIHRDIKPSNVLVALHDETPVPKVIDFGVAKAVGQQLTDKTVYTAFGALIGTPAYMAPEQATFNQLDVDTRADVYALGVLLYELLAGSPPFEPERLRQAAIDEVLRLVREEEPPRPSARLSTSQAKATIAATRQTDPDQLAKLIRGELDWIVMKSLEKDRGRRYDSAAGLAKDVERYLKDEAVEACPPTLGYRMRKTFRRHKAAILTAAAFVLVLVAAAAVAAWQAVRATDAERATAVERDRTAEQRDAADEARREAIKQFNIAKEQVTTASALTKKVLLAQRALHATQYHWDMQLMPLAWEAGNLNHVRGLLDRYRPGHPGSDLVGFEWHYWNRQLNPELGSFRIPAASATATELVLSDDATRVLAILPAVPSEARSAPVDQLLKVWDATTGKEIASHPLVKAPGRPRLSHARFSRDGTKVALSWAGEQRPAKQNSDGTFTPYRQVRVVDLTSGKTLVSYAPPNTDAECWNLSLDGRRFAVVAKRNLAAGLSFPSIKVWDVESGAELFSVPGDADGDFAPPFTPDGTQIACVLATERAGVRALAVIDATTGKDVHRWDIACNLPPSLAFSPDGVRIAGVLRSGVVKEANLSAAVKVWDRVAGKELHTLPAPSGANALFGRIPLAFNADGSRLLVHSTVGARAGALPGRDVHVYDPVGGKPQFAFTTPVIQDVVAFTHDGKQVVATEGQLVTLRNATTGQVERTIKGHTNRVAAFALTPDDRELRTLEQTGTVKAWVARPAPPVVFAAAPREDAGVGASALAPDGRTLALIVPGPEGEQPALTIRDTATGKTVHTIPLTATKITGANYQLDFSGDGKRLALARWPRPAPRRVREKEPDGTLERFPAELMVWNTGNGTPVSNVTLGRFPVMPRVGLALSPDGSRAAMLVDGQFSKADVYRPMKLKVFDTRTGQAVFEAPAAALGSRFAFSPDGKRIAGAVQLTKEDQWIDHGQGIKIWDAETGRELRMMELGGVAAFPAWSPDGSRLAVGYRPARGVGMLKVYDPATGAELFAVEDPAGTAANRGVTAPVYSPDGRRIAGHLTTIARGLNTAPEVRVWDAATGKELLTLKSTGTESSALAFTRDGYQLIEAAYAPVSYGKSATSRGITMTVWDATPRAKGAAP